MLKIMNFMNLNDCCVSGGSKIGKFDNLSIFTLIGIFETVNSLRCILALVS